MIDVSVDMDSEWDTGIVEAAVSGPAEAEAKPRALGKTIKKLEADKAISEKSTAPRGQKRGAKRIDDNGQKEVRVSPTGKSNEGGYN